QIVVDLCDRRHSLGKGAVIWSIDLVIAGATGCIIGAATTGIIGWFRGGTEKSREHLARHQARAGRCTSGTLLNRVRKQDIEVGFAARKWLTADNIVAVPARVDGAVTEANELIDGLCSRRARHRNGGSERQKTQYMIHATPPNGIPFSHTSE